MLLVNGILDPGEECPLATNCFHKTCKASTHPSYKLPYVFDHKYSCGLARMWRYTSEGREALKELKRNKDATIYTTSTG